MSDQKDNAAIPLTPKPADLNKAQSSMFNSILQNSFGLGLFAIFTVGLISLTWVFTQEKIISEVRAYEARILLEILPIETHDNILVDSRITIAPSKQLSTKQSRDAYIARENGDISAIILPTIAPDGYNGRIELLVGINIDGTLVGVRAITHKETPGLGDKINTTVSDWIHGFAGKSLINPSAEGWLVAKDGGQFDQFIGATITPRAVVASVYRALEYFRDNKNQLLGNQPAIQKDNTTEISQEVK